MKIEVGESYLTRNGGTATIICDDLKGPNYPIVARVGLWGREVVNTYTREGRVVVSQENPMDLVQKVHPYHTFKVDEPVWVRDKSGVTWCKRHFAKPVEPNKAGTYPNGRTAHTHPGLGIETWDLCVRNDPEAS